MEDRIEYRAMKLDETYFEGKGWGMKNVSPACGEYCRYDLFLQKGTEELRVVYFLSDGDAPQLELIPRDAIPPEYVIPRFGAASAGGLRMRAQSASSSQDRQRS